MPEPGGRLPNLGIVGRARSGKDTVAEHLVHEFGYVRVGLADPLKRLAVRLDPLIGADSPVAAGETGFAAGLRLAELVHRVGWEQAKDQYPEVRRTLQRLGTDVVREAFGADTWVRLALELVHHHNAAGRPVVIPDVRFPNEALLLRQLGEARLLRVRRPSVSTTDNHDSERLTDSIPVDQVVTNDRDVPALLARVDVAIRCYERTSPV